MAFQPADPFYVSCRLCPRLCGTNRASGGRGRCGESAVLRLACASIHRGEEPPLTGGPDGGGSGAIFVSGCNLGCSFCQNRQISRTPDAMGAPVDTAEFGRICAALRERGAENINIVTGSHAVPALAGGLRAAGKSALPVLWNSSAYELPETLELLDSLVDIFLPDLKTLDAELASRFFDAPDYPARAASAVLKMLELARPAGSVPAVIVRHLVLPGYLESTRGVLRWFAENAAGKALLSLMFQYTPNDTSFGMPDDAPAGPGRYVNEKEYETTLDWLEEFGIEDGYCQELIPGNEWLPGFEKINPFLPELAEPVWHWKTGFV
jgi:putative pyruvate formate lyase activating enzyme